MDYARTVLTGRIGGDAKFYPATIGSDGKVANQARTTFTVIVNWFWKEDGQGDHTGYPCVLWGPRAEKIHQYLKAGKQVLVEGIPQLYPAGELPQADGSTKSIRGFSLKVTDISLGNDSRKNQPTTVMQPAMLDLLKAIADKTGIDVEKFLGQPAQTPAVAPQVEVPFGS